MFLQDQCPVPQPAVARPVVMKSSENVGREEDNKRKVNEVKKLGGTQKKNLKRRRRHVKKKEGKEREREREKKSKSYNSYCT